MRKRPKHKLPPKDVALLKRAELLAVQRMQHNPPPAYPPTREEIEAELRARAAAVNADFARNHPGSRHESETRSAA